MTENPHLTPPVLAGRGVTKRYGATTVLDHVDLDVGPGETVAVTGPSGSGKSTLLHCLAGITTPDDGEIVLAGERVDRLTESRRAALRRERIGFVFQFGQLLPELPAVENVALPLMLSGVRRSEAVRRAAAWFTSLGIEGLELRRPGQLSGGQEQRVAIARALVAGPAVVFADEPTGALDSATGAQVIGLLTGLAVRTGTALVVVTHDADVAARCHRTVSLRDGRVATPTVTSAGAGA
ncbi:putative ABC transport system ATP-binding protein [Pseudonocardia sediminis]|uniref:Putative ABC transport system ATP-binding protein n=1 Tax=Pseudonocardia sediminis TaxID=1397368 RepID=A0A4Q7V3J6_PSEST|nr:ABC transporter ATP-binding protein [Pseudonocardia sediminis]RZT88675.1 putative ABC transport system ATP-binding protein [Pseudonocardia sediminis]